MVIAKTNRFNLLSELVVIYIKALYRSQQKAIGFVYFLIELPNLFDIQEILTKNNIFKAFTIKYI